MCIEKVSVVVPVHNGEKTITTCIDSLLNIDYPGDKFELIIVENNSADNTETILESYADRIILIKEAKRGPSAARNKGINMATGDIIAFTDADCVVDKNWINNLVCHFRNKNPGVVAGKILPLKPHDKMEEYMCGLHNHLVSVKRKMPYAITINWASRKSVLQAVGLFDESFLRSQDSELSFRIYQKGYELIYEPNAIVFHKDPATYHELFRKAYLSGYWNIKYYKKHQNIHKSLGLKKFRIKVIVRILNLIYKLMSGNRNDLTKYELVYSLGRQTGKLFGSMRFLYLDF